MHSADNIKAIKNRDFCRMIFVRTITHYYLAVILHQFTAISVLLLHQLITSRKQSSYVKKDHNCVTEQCGH